MQDSRLSYYYDTPNPTAASASCIQFGRFCNTSNTSNHPTQGHHHVGCVVWFSCRPDDTNTSAAHHHGIEAMGRFPLSTALDPSALQPQVVAPRSHHGRSGLYCRL